MYRSNPLHDLSGTYGPLAVTTASALVLVTPAMGNYTAYNSYTQLPVVISVTDEFGQVRRVLRGRGGGR